MELNSHSDYQIIIDGRYSLFHKHLSFYEFCFEAVRSFSSSSKIKYDEKIADLIKEIYAKAKNPEILDFLNFDVLKNEKLLSSLKIEANRSIEESKLIGLYKETVIKIKILDDFIKENKYTTVVLLPFSHQLKENYYKNLFFHNSDGNLIKSIKFIQKSNLKNANFPLIPDKTPVFISHKLNIFQSLVKIHEKSIQIYFNNIFYNPKTKEKLENLHLKIDFSLNLLNALPYAFDFLRQKALKSPDVKIIRIGYFLMAKKIEDMFTKQMIRSVFPFEFVPLDLRYPISNDNFDMIVHKITDLIKYYGTGETMNACSENFRIFYEKNKEKLIFIDKLEGINIVNSRVIFQDVFEKLFIHDDFLKKMEMLGANYKIKVPKMIEVGKGMKYELIEEKITQSHLNFPLIVKTKMALGEAKTHYMAIGLDFEGLKIIEQHENFRNEEHILQEFVNHDETIFKIYVIGEKSHYYTRQSLPNMTEEILGNSSFFFDSQIPFKDQLEYLKKRKGDFTEKNVKIDEKLFEMMTGCISEKLGFSLYGYDLIKDYKSGDVYIVDINYFPGFKFEGDLQKLFWEFFMNKLKQKKK